MNPWELYQGGEVAPWEQYKASSGEGPWNSYANTPTQVTQIDPDANVRKFLDFLGRAEGADYNTIVGGGTFNDFRSHPRTVGLVTKEGPSTAAGRYQITKTTYDAVAARLGIRDFTPDSQDRIAIELIREKGALEDIRAGNFDAAVSKLGGVWASLPSSPYSQPKRSAEWVKRELGGAGSYTAFAPVRQNVDPKSLEADEDWIRASLMLYSLWEKKPFEGTNKDAATWGKDMLGYFNYNMVDMARLAYAVSNGTQEEKEAFLYLMDTYDNTEFSLEGAGRFAKGVLTDPTNLVGLGTLGFSFLGKEGAKVATKQGLKAAIKESVKTSLGRTGIAAGMEGAIFSAADSTIRQGVEVSAGRRQEVDLSKVGLDTAIGATAGVVLGTSADMAASGIAKLFRKDVPTTDITVPTESPNVSGAVTDSQRVLEIPSGVVTPSTIKTESGQPIVLYHGTKQKDPFDTFEVSASGSNTGNDGYWGKGVSLTEDLDTATNYSIYDNSGNEVSGGRVVSTVADLNNPFEVVNDGGLADRLLALNGWTEKEKSIIQKSGGWLTGDIPGYRISKVMQDNGYDGVIVRGNKFVDDGTGKTVQKPIISEVVVFDPKNVKILDQGVSPEGKLGSTLTPAELQAAMARQQPGRLPQDDIIPDIPPGTQQITLPPRETTGARLDKPVNMAEQGKVAQSIVEQLRTIPTKDLPAVLESLRTRTDLSLDDIPTLARGLQDYAKELKVQLAEVTKALNKDPNNPDLLIRKTELEARDAAILADDAVGTLSGVLLRQRQEGLPGVQGLTVEDVMQQQNLSRQEAEQVWADMVGKAHLQDEANNVARQYDPQIQQAIREGNLSEAARLTVLKRREQDALLDNTVSNSSTLIDKLTEFAISNVFSLKTLIINLVPSGLKTLVIPSLKAILNNPLEKATRAEFMGAYSAMRSNFGSALKAARAGFRYEQALLTRDGTRLVEGELALQGNIAGVWRIFPRLLNASDEFLSRINYSSFIAGRAASDAAIEGAKKGLTGKELNAFIKEATESALKEASTPTTGDELVQPIINKGLNLGYTGDELWKYVEREAVRDPASLQKGTDEEALNFVRDVLYKKQFSGTNAGSKFAQWYEDGMKKFPTLKLVIGQLFFRTPIRVFEEGVRLTPGLQFIAPKFLDDLRGLNGAGRQVRAQAEAMTSLAAASAVLSLYAQGRITGDGAYSDYKQQKTRMDGSKPEPYTITLSDGSTWNYRNFDPLATPLKIMVNALERMDKLRIREAQGDFVDAKEYEYPMAAITVATTAVASAIRDASLVEGADNFGKFLESLGDPEEASWVKMLGDKLFLLVPNTLHKIARENDPTLKDPQTFWQMVEQKLMVPLGLPSPGETSAKAYDVLGNPRKISDTGVLWDVFSTSSVEERRKGLSDKELFVLDEMDALTRGLPLQQLTFKPPLKVRELGDLDMRKVMATDGKRTLYDVWMENYKSLNPAESMYPILAAEMPKALKFQQMRAEMVKEVQSDLYQAALQMTMAQEGAVIKRYQDELLRKAGLSKQGTLLPY